MPTIFWKEFPKIFEAAIKSNLGVFALLACIVALIAWLFFGRGRSGPKVFAFLLLFLGVCALGYATFDSAQKMQIIEDERNAKAQKCLGEAVAKFQDKKPIFNQNQVRCEGGGTGGAGQTKNDVVSLDAPPGYMLSGAPIIKDVKESRGSQGALQFVAKDGLTVGARLPIRCESPSQMFGPGAWMGATLEGTIERPISETKRVELAKQCGFAK